jgi:predicted dehydrogenase/aryl-alcohol dehydrogenase-like predicted oxidoreductase
MSGSLRWGILGTGRIAHVLANAIEGSKTGKLIAVGSRHEKTAREFARQHSLDKVYGSYGGVLDDPEVEVVYISMIHPLHAEWTIRAAEAGKHILCEKPLAMNFGESTAAIEAARQHDVYLAEAFPYRFTPQTGKMLELIRNGAIGEVKMIESSFSYRVGDERAGSGRLFELELGGGGILDVGCYPISLARLVAGQAMGRPFANPLTVRGFGHIGPTGVDDYATALLKFEGDIIAQVSTGIRVSHGNAARIYGTGGYLEIEYPWWSKGGICLHRAGKKAKPVETKAEFSLYVYEVDAVADHLEARQAPMMGWDDSLGNMHALDEWRRQIGLVYPCEEITSSTWPIARPPLKRSARHNMRYGRIAGLKKEISRLVMGVDNQPNDVHAAVLFDDYFERGGNCFDCSECYGPYVRELILGRWQNNRGVREEVILLDKGGHTPFNWPSIVDLNIPKSLERLQSDYIDIYMLHRDNLEVPVGEYIDMLNGHIEAGRIHLIGASNWSLERFIAANQYAEENGKIGFAALSNNFSLARMINPVWTDCIASSEPTYKAWHEATGMPLMPWSSQARGFFTERAAPDKLDDRELVNSWYSPENFDRKARAEKLAREKGVLPINIALAFVLSQSFPTFALIGPRNLEETRTSLPGLDVELTPEECRWLDLEAEEPFEVT